MIRIDDEIRLKRREKKSFERKKNNSVKDAASPQGFSPPDVTLTSQIVERVNMAN